MNGMGVRFCECCSLFTSEKARRTVARKNCLAAMHHIGATNDRGAPKINFKLELYISLGG